MSQSQTNATLGQRRVQVIPGGCASATNCYVARASGSLVWDMEGREYIDFSGGIAVMNVGHSHPHVVSAIKDQAEKFTHTCFMVMPYEPAVQIAEKLCAALPGEAEKSALLANSGAEAVENAVKIARCYRGQPAVLSFENAFHGRTMLGMSLTSKVKPYKYGFGPFVPEIYRLPFAYCYRCPLNLVYPSCDTACVELIRELFVTHVAPENIAAIIAEPIQGEGGFITPPPEYFPKLKKICQENGILLIADEVQTGIGRTGKMFAMEHWNVEADLTTVAKSLGAGMPLGAVAGKKEIMESVHPGGLGSTYGGNPVACRAALAVMEIFETEDLLAKAEALGRKLKTRFEAWRQEFELIGDVRGLGPMLALELVEDRHTREPAPKKTSDLIQYCYQKGLILLSCGSRGNIIRVLMPLVIGDGELEQGLAIMEDGFRKIEIS